MRLAWVYVFVGIYVAVVVGESISQLTYHRKPIEEIRAGFRWILLKSLLMTAVLIVSTVVWEYMGWQEGQPIHLPWTSF